MPYIVAMSGGVDSSVSLLLAKRMLGNDALGLTLKLTGTPSDEENSREAAAICESLGCAHVSLDAVAQFQEKVKKYFTDEYMAGRTPNPCVICNREIKLGLVSDWADRHGYREIVTGHYARVKKIGGYSYVSRAADPAKDQSYMLAMLTQDEISRLVLPLGELTKNDVRELATEQGFANAKKGDSQDICFVPNGDYVEYLARSIGHVPEAGEYVDAAGNVLGVHKGHVCYTVGQRKGLGISLGKRAVVLSKDARANRVVLGDEADVYRREVSLSGISLPSDPHALDGVVRCEAKIRYAHRAACATFTRTSEDTGVLVFDEAVRAPSPGQFAVMYSDDCVIGAGVIEW